MGNPQCVGCRDEVSRVVAIVFPGYRGGNRVGVEPKGEDKQRQWQYDLQQARLGFHEYSQCFHPTD